MLLPLLLSAFAAAADFRLVGPPMSKQHAQQACAQENMTLAHVTRRNLAACAAAASKTTQPAVWIAHGDRHVVLFNGAAAKASSDPNERCYTLCTTANAKRAAEPTVLQKAAKKTNEPQKLKQPKSLKSTQMATLKSSKSHQAVALKKPKSAQTVALKEVRKAHHTHDPKQAGKKCRKGCYEHSFSTSDSWTSTHVSHEIKTRVPCRSHKHIYKKDCSVSSCSTSSESPCTESSSWTTEEVVRPHKRKHYRKQVSVKDKVKPQEVHHEVVRKQPKCDKKPHDKKDKRKERKMRCHGGQCRLTRSEPSASYSGYSDERRDGQYRLHKRAYSSDDEGTDSEDIETPTATTTTSDVKKQAKQMREVMHAARDNGKQGAHERYRAPIQFPSSTTKKPAKPDTKKPTKPDTKSSSKSCSTPSSSESCSASSSSESCSASSSCSQPRRKLVYKVKKGKSGCRPYVEIPNKRYRPSPSSSSSSSCTSSSSSSEAYKKGHASRHRHHSSTCSRSTESCHKHKHRCHHKCKKGGHKESPKTEPTKGKPKKAEEKPAKQAEKKPAKKADSKTGQKTGSKNEEKPKAAKSEQKSKTAKSEQKASAAKGKKPAADAPKKKEQQQKQKAKPTKQARRKHSSTESSSSSSSYEEKVAKKISVNPVSTSGSSSRKPVVLKKKHVKCRA